MADADPGRSNGGNRLERTALADDIEFLTARARVLGAAVANRRFADVGLRARTYSVLALACSGEGPSQRELAEFLQLDASQIVSLVDELEGRGLVSRIPDAADRRSKIIIATDAGRSLFSEAQDAARAAEDESLDRLTPVERDQLRDLLKRVAFDPSN